MANETICVIGLGYIGLPTASLLASRGMTVHGVDVRESTVQAINRGEVPIVEPDLATFLEAAVRSRKLTAHLKPAPADIFILAVPTPFRDGHKPDLSYVEAAARAIAPYVKPGNLVILESTSPVGTTEAIGKWLSEMRPELAVAGIRPGADAVQLAHCPERVLPGQIMRELVENDRIVGGVDAASTARAAGFYRTFVAGKVLETDARTAELAKLTENSFRDVNIAFANELSLICDHLGINVWELIRLANHHPRVNILQPGPGVGGHCIAVDPWFIVDSAPAQARLIRTAREVNDSKPEFVVDKILAAVADAPRATIACLGLAFKANIDDLRESPAIHVVELLRTRCANPIVVCEPHVDTAPRSLQVPTIAFTRSAAQAIKDADVVVLLVDHRDFGDLRLSDFARKTLIDTRGSIRA